MTMGCFFLDDSKHPEAGFCLTSFVFSPIDPQKDIEQILLRRGLAPGRDEYKSSARMPATSTNGKVRGDLTDYIRNSCKVALAISSAEQDMYRDAASLLDKMFSHPEIGQGDHFDFTDRGIVTNRKEREAFLAVKGASTFSFRFEQDSKDIAGIQLADLSAHICAIMMKDSLGLITKTVKLVEDGGYDPDVNIGLGFEMFAAIRYSFLGVYAPYVWGEPDPPLQPLLLVSDYGLQISEKLSATVKTAAESRFASFYLGCIH